MTTAAASNGEDRTDRGGRRLIGPWGTVARVLVGFLLVASVAASHVSFGDADGVAVGRLCDVRDPDGLTGKEGRERVSLERGDGPVEGPCDSG